MTAFLSFALAATMYTDTGPLYCGGYTHTLHSPWVAMPVSQHGQTWQCGDLLYLRFEDGSTLLARALDAGPFGAYCVQRDDGCLPIAVDVPVAWAPFAGLSSGVQVYNVTAEVRWAKVQ